MSTFEQLIVLANQITALSKMSIFVFHLVKWDSNPGPFADRANTTTELPSNPVISPTTFQLKPTLITRL